MTSLELTSRFINGLQQYDLTVEEVSKWKYCGGNKGRHANYFKLSCPKDDLIEYTERCICGHLIVENCYITDGKEILVLGNCCIQRFIPKCSRTCEMCGEPHRSRKVNRCNKCKKIQAQPTVGLCKTCNKKIDVRFKNCYSCHVKSKRRDETRMAKLRDKCRCGKYKDKKYEICYACKSCEICGGSGRMYLSDNTYCSCECTGKPFDDID